MKDHAVGDAAPRQAVLTFHYGAVHAEGDGVRSTVALEGLSPWDDLDLRHYATMTIPRVARALCCGSGGVASLAPDDASSSFDRRRALWLTAREPGQPVRVVRGFPTFELLARSLVTHVLQPRLDPDEGEARHAALHRLLQAHGRLPEGAVWPSRKAILARLRAVESPYLLRATADPALGRPTRLPVGSLYAAEATQLDNLATLEALGDLVETWRQVVFSTLRAALGSKPTHVHAASAASGVAELWRVPGPLWLRLAADRGGADLHVYETVVPRRLDSAFDESFVRRQLWRSGGVDRSVHHWRERETT